MPLSMVHKILIKNMLAMGVIVFLAAPIAVWATPPSDMKLNYDLASKTLHIEIQHVTNNNRKHFIRKLLIENNKKEVKTIEYVSQPTPNTFSEDVALDAKKGDVIRVTATCIKGGRGTEKLKIP